MTFGWLSWRWTGSACWAAVLTAYIELKVGKKEVSCQYVPEQLIFGVDHSVDLFPFVLSQALIFSFYVSFQECIHVCVVSLGFEFGGGDENDLFLFDGDHPNTNGQAIETHS